METILARWEAFAATRLPAARDMAALELRDHAQLILEAVVADLRTPQTREEQAAKSMGLAPAVSPARETAAQVHAMLRAHSGIDITQVASEYRALRASVLSLWVDAEPVDAPGLDDVIRFNEAIDQALVESIAHFGAQVEQSRNLLLGMLGHDMRSPLQAIQVTAYQLSELNGGDKVSEAAKRLISSGNAMQGLLDDLMDFSRSNLGLGINVTPSDVDLGALSSEALEQIRAGHAGSRLELTVAGDCRGYWDGKRLQQLLRNLVINAISHGEPTAPVRVEVTGEDRDVRIDVRNSGAAMSSTTLSQLFQPLKRGEDTRPPGGNV